MKHTHPKKKTTTIYATKAVLRNIKLVSGEGVFAMFASGWNPQIIRRRDKLRIDYLEEYCRGEGKRMRLLEPLV